MQQPRRSLLPLLLPRWVQDTGPQPPTAPGSPQQPGSCSVPVGRHTNWTERNPLTSQLVRPPCSLQCKREQAATLSLELGWAVYSACNTPACSRINAPTNDQHKTSCTSSSQQQRGGSRVRRGLSVHAPSPETQPVPPVLPSASRSSACPRSHKKQPWQAQSLFIKMKSF